ncbi:Pyruvate-flavodoxin oxidoreductase, central domain protein [Acididesulfobacillus acetoxydans]|uniref:Pyruvate ferredoxin/flavodoxin oxidoreductase n=1 Tax=Acididesulfobacillus acetoxydans TaxID=1561005 RepID=A0A8S0W7U2_9FIRM|nr:indolepyruvate oxidoreductase subunit beta [Acididesulfobacillus acetoxydans]CAA7601129.1 Pyruvate-flavodoxin oxidoreductase, central domain protein [Acididesulfobacillus acetoxydans]CEJ08592.1 Pyruvate ferredoxin/flavodoxin oxidoreductase [Acididesulfobacillus acetoxydans]
MPVTNVLLCGVGGQGVLLASEVLALVAAEEKAEVKQTEVHGVAQRGGSVVSHLRFGEGVYSPIVRTGEADILLAFERLEAVRYGYYVKPGGLILINDVEIMPGQIGEYKPYPAGIMEFLSGKGLRLQLIPAAAEAKALGNVRVSSLILLGVLSQHLDLSPRAWETVIRRRIPERLLEVNLKAFEAGVELGRSQVEAAASGG